MPLNAAWHNAHPMPKNPTLEQRMAWHTEHAQVCGCRPIPPKVLAEIGKRKALAKKDALP